MSSLSFNPNRFGIRDFRTSLTTEWHCQWRNYCEERRKSLWPIDIRGWLEPEIDYDNVSAFISESVNKLCKDWDFLNMFVTSILRSNVGDEFRSLTQLIECVGAEIATDLDSQRVAYKLFKSKIENLKVFPKINITDIRNIRTALIAGYAVCHSAYVRAASAATAAACIVIIVPACVVIYQYFELEVERGLYSSNWFREILSLLARCQSKTDGLSKSNVVRLALKDLSKFTIHSHSPGFQFCTDFVHFVGETLGSVSDESLNYIPSELISIHRYLDGVPQGFRSASDDAIDAFLSHVQSVILRIAVQICNFWFNTTDQETRTFVATQVVDLYEGIDPSNPQFLELNLRFQSSLRKINFRDEYHFCDYVLAWIGEEELRKELMSLVTLFINTTLEDGGGENVHSFFAEIRAVLAEAAFTCRKAKRQADSIPRPASMPPCPELFTKICLHKAELLLKEQLNTHTPSMLFNVNTIRTSLRGFTNYASQQRNTEYVKQSMEFAEVLADQIDFLQSLLHSKSITSPLLKHSLLQLLFKIAFFKAASFLSLLSKSSDTSISNGQKDQIFALLEMLKYFKSIEKNKFARNSSDKEIEAVVRGITLLSYSFLPDNEKFEKVIHSLPRLLSRAETIRAKLTEMSQQFPKCIFPKTNEKGFIDFLDRNLRKLLEHDPESIAPVKHQIVEVQFHLESLKFSLMKVKDLDVQNIIEVAYKLEYVVESIEVDGHFQQSLWLHDLLDDIRIADQQVSHIPDDQQVPCSSKVQNLLTKISDKMLSQDTKAAVDDMVDLDDQQEAIIQRLIRGSKPRDVVSIVGMGGSGKTTLARRVYENKEITYHFHCRAWCPVSQVYSKKGAVA